MLLIRHRLQLCLQGKAAGEQSCALAATFSAEREEHCNSLRLCISPYSVIAKDGVAGGPSGFHLPADYSPNHFCDATRGLCGQCCLWDDSKTLFDVLKQLLSAVS